MRVSPYAEDFLKLALSADEFGAIEALPKETVYELYPDICSYGPNGDNYREALADLTNALKNPPPETSKLRDLSALASNFNMLLIPTTRQIRKSVESSADKLVRTWDIHHYALISSWLGVVIGDGLVGSAMTVLDYRPIYWESSILFGLNPEKYIFRGPELRGSFMQMGKKTDGLH